MSAWRRAGRTLGAGSSACSGWRWTIRLRTRTWSSRVAEPAARSANSTGPCRSTVSGRSAGSWSSVGRTGQEHPMSVKAGQPAAAPRVRPRSRGRPGHLRARAGRAVRGPVQAVPAAQGGLPGRGRLPPHRPDRHCLPQGRRPPARGALRRRVRGQQPARSGLPDPHAQRPRGQDHRRLVAGGHAGRPRARIPRPRRRSPRECRCSSAPAGSSPRRAPTW